MTEASKAFSPVTMTTASGEVVDPLRLLPHQIDMDVVFWSLSTKVRYNGHLGYPWTVGLHSISLAQYVAIETRDYRAFRVALLHDAAEAYLGDIVRPLKVLPAFAFFRDVEDSILAAVLERAGLSTDIPEIVKEADRRIVTNEVRVFHPVPPSGTGWPEPLPWYVNDILLDHLAGACSGSGKDWFRYAYKGANALFRISEGEFGAYVDSLLAQNYRLDRRIDAPAPAVVAPPGGAG